MPERTKTQLQKRGPPGRKGDGGGTGEKKGKSKKVMNQKAPWKESGQPESARKKMRTAKHQKKDRKTKSHGRGVWNCQTFTKSVYRGK